MKNNLKEWGLVIVVALLFAVVPMAINMYDQSVEREN